jgi:hypothetical protein
MSNYTQTATYWAPTTINKFGEQTFETPASISVRWEEKTEMFLDRDTGKELMSKSVVYLKQDVLENGFLYLGTTALQPSAKEKAFRIKRFDKIPSLKGNKYIRKAWL